MQYVHVGLQLECYCCHETTRSALRLVCDTVVCDHCPGYLGWSICDSCEEVPSTHPSTFLFLPPSFPFLLPFPSSFLFLPPTCSSVRL